MAYKSLTVRLYIDGGARGNPGPAGAGVVLCDAADGQNLHEAGYFLGDATNNVAEYTALLHGLRTAAQLKAGAVEVYSDSQLLVRQMNGEYRVKNENLRVLHDQAAQLVRGFRDCTFHHVPREQNADADRLANRAINARRNVEGAET